MSSSFRFTVRALALSIGLAAAAPAALAGTGTIYVSRMPDGTLSLGDRPAAGAVSTSRHEYAGQTADQRASADKDRSHWREEADAFQRRHGVSRRTQFAGHPGQWDPRDPYVQYAPHPWVVGGGLVHRQPQASVYTSSPGVLQGRTTPFIGSGFGSARP